MSDESRIQQAAKFLFDEERGGRPFALIPDAFAPRTIDEAYAVQDAFVASMAAIKGQPAGYKIALTTSVTQKLVGFHEPIAGLVLGRTVHKSPHTVSSADVVRLGVECEIAVQLRTSLPAAKAPFTRPAVAEAVGVVMPAIELIDDRNTGGTRLSGHVLPLVADNVWNAGIVLGSPLLDWRELDLAAAHGALSVNGEIVGEGHGRDVMGHPLEALTWLANMLAQRGKSLAEGEVIITGSIVAPKFLRVGDMARATVQGLGDAEVRFT